MLNKLDYWLRPIDKIFTDFASYVVGQGKERRIFVDRGADVLFVAHLDTVQQPMRRKTRRKYRDKRIYAQGLDDRLGCLIASELAEKLGADLLLTDLEEQCQTTAQYHDCKDYNWIAEFDRCGGDVVTYALDSSEFRTALEEHFTIGFGSYSDICDLKTDCCCVNIGIGYELAHSKDSYVVIKTMQAQIDRFVEFYTENKDVAYKRDEDPWDDRTYQPNYWGIEEHGDCDVCGIPGAIEVYGYYVCEDCFCNMFESKVLDERIRT